MVWFVLGRILSIQCGIKVDKCFHVLIIIFNEIMAKMCNMFIPSFNQIDFKMFVNSVVSERNRLLFVQVFLCIESTFKIKEKSGYAKKTQVETLVVS